MDHSTSTMRPSRPQSVKELAAQADNFSFHTTIPIKHWTRAADALFQEAEFALSEGDYGRAYMMLLRHSTLVIQYLPTHPQFKDPESQKAFRPIKKRLKAVLLDLEQLKPEIERDYEEWIRMAPPPIQREPSAETLPSYESFAAQDPTLSGNVKILDASENQELAVDLARQDTRRRDKARRATVQAGISDEDAQSRRMAGRWEDWDAQMPMSNDVGLQAQMEAARRTLDAANEGRSHESPSSPVSTHNYSYPSVSKSRPVDLDVARPPSYTSFEDQPSRPPKELERPFSQLRFDDREQIPEGPTKAPLQNYESLVPHTTNNRNGPPRPPPKLSDRQPLKPPKERLTFKPGAYLENGDPIRSLFLPKHLRLKFLDKARKNTEAGLEMCGILCGRPVNNALFVSCLLIPDQICTTDTCETENESSMFDYMDKQELLTVGWIHTHPTQTCFMSSRDLHTHAGYQVMMKESVAIVCAPRSDPSHGIFRLTHPPGLDHIINCHLPGIFHPHEISNLYTSAARPRGHVYESDKLELEVVDLRSK